MSSLMIKTGRTNIVVCADGSGIAKDGMIRADFEKLFQLGAHTVVGIIGTTHLRPDDEIAARIVRLCRKDALKDDPRAFLAALQNDLHQGFLRRLADNPSDYAWLQKDGVKIQFAAYCITKRPSGEIDILGLEFPLESDNGRPVLGVPVIRAHADGFLPIRPIVFNVGCGLEKDPLPALDPDLNDRAIVAAVDSMVAGFKNEFAICRNEMGGTIGIMVLDPSGARWLRKDRSKASLLGRRRRRLSTVFAAARFDRKDIVLSAMRCATDISRAVLA